MLTLWVPILTLVTEGWRIFNWARNITYLILKLTCLKLSDAYGNELKIDDSESATKHHFQAELSLPLSRLLMFTPLMWDSFFFVSGWGEWLLFLWFLYFSLKIILHMSLFFWLSTYVLPGRLILLYFDFRSLCLLPMIRSILWTLCLK